MLNDTYLNRANSIRAIDSSSQTEKWNEKKLYWVSQIAGWSVFAVVNLVIIAAFGRYTWQRLVVFIIICLFGLLSTHQFRNYIKKNNWINLPIKITSANSASLLNHWNLDLHFSIQFRLCTRSIQIRRI